MTSATSCALEAMNNITSVFAVMPSEPYLTSFLILSPMAVPPGSIAPTTSIPWHSRYSRRIFSCVPFPEPSGPSRTMNLPFSFSLRSKPIPFHLCVASLQESASLQGFVGCSHIAHNCAHKAHISQHSFWLPGRVLCNPSHKPVKAVHQASDRHRPLYPVQPSPASGQTLPFAVLPGASPTAPC